MLNRKITLLILFGLFTTPAAFAQTEALKVVVNKLAYYRQHAELKYLINAKKSVDSLIVTKSDSNKISKNIYKAIVYASIAYVDSTNRLNQPADFADKTIKLVDQLAKRDKIYKYEPEMEFAKRCLANVLTRRGFDQLKKSKYKDALQSFQKAQEYAPNYAQLENYIAYANAKAGNLQEAVKFYQSKIIPDSAKVENVAAAVNIYKAMGDTAKALQLLQKGRRFLPAEKSLLLEEVNIYNNQKDYKSLEPLLIPLLDNNQNDAAMFFLAANCYDQLKKYDRAESLYLRAIELNNSYYEAAFNLGALYLKMAAKYAHKSEEGKNLELAAQWLSRAYNINPNNVVNLKLLQLIYAKTGDNDRLNLINTKLQQLNK